MANRSVREGDCVEMAVRDVWRAYTNWTGAERGSKSSEGREAYESGGDLRVAKYSGLPAS